MVISRQIGVTELILSRVGSYVFDLNQFHFKELGNVDEDGEDRDGSSSSPNMSTIFSDALGRMSFDFESSVAVNADGNGC